MGRAVRVALNLACLVFLVVGAWRRAGGRALAGAPGPNKGPLGTRLATLTLWYGTTTLATLVLLVGCAALLRRRRDRPPAAAPALEVRRAPAQAA